MDPDEQGIVDFMCGNRQFNEERIRTGCQKIKKTRNTSTQGRLDGFFKVLSTTPSTPVNNKRKSDVKKESSAKKAKTMRRGPK